MSDRLIFIMGITIHIFVRWHLNIETVPWLPLAVVWIVSLNQSCLPCCQFLSASKLTSSRRLNIYHVESSYFQGLDCGWILIINTINTRNHKLTLAICIWNIGLLQGLISSNNIITQIQIKKRIKQYPDIRFLTITFTNYHGTLLNFTCSKFLSWSLLCC